ncbi:hypothetical protein SAMN06295885_3676 [Rathayibacter oskolensis]|uniref:Uncharacterized protein n=1 Tax=Rathayibacter oskolensis TaxID=1891671 RepID=A0A1X7PK05_9MICO|nr:hypothetical protein [Rathayibacter oskolensis]SMH51032.1 hypothetical protein SAMN06295885_3676 [Rathayibacter oskolensis]
MAFTSRRWQVGTIVARVRASAAIGAADLATSARATRKLDVLRIADGVDTGRITNEQALAAFSRIAEELQLPRVTSIHPTTR